MTLLSTPDHTELTETMAKHSISALQQVEEGNSPAFQSRADYRGHPAILQLIGTYMHVTAPLEDLSKASLPHAETQ